MSPSFRAIIGAVCLLFCVLAISVGEVERAVRCLESAYLLSRRGDVWSLPENAIGHLTFDEDAERYFEQSIEAVM